MYGIAPACQFIPNEGESPSLGRSSVLTSIRKTPFTLRLSSHTTLSHLNSEPNTRPVTSLPSVSLYQVAQSKNGTSFRLFNKLSLVQPFTNIYTIFITVIFIFTPIVVSNNCRAYILFYLWYCDILIMYFL